MCPAAGCPRVPSFAPHFAIPLSWSSTTRASLLLCSDFCKPFVVEAKRHTNRTLLNRIQSKEAVFTRGARGSGGARRPEFKFGAVWEHTPGNRHIHIYSKVGCWCLCLCDRRCRRRDRLFGEVMRVEVFCRFVLHRTTFNIAFEFLSIYTSLSSFARLRHLFWCAHHTCILLYTARSVFPTASFRAPNDSLFRLVGSLPLSLSPAIFLDYFVLLACSGVGGEQDGSVACLPSRHPFEGRRREGRSFRTPAAQRDLPHGR